MLTGLRGVPLTGRIIVLSGFAERICDGEQPVIIVIGVLGDLPQLVIFPSFVPVSVVFEPLTLAGSVIVMNRSVQGPEV